MKESEIRPEALFDRYLELSRRDIATFFADHAAFREIRCPACDSKDSREGFEKLGFHYRVCEQCSSLFLSPRPTEEMQAAYSRQSEAVEFWSTHFYRETADARREKMFRPRAQQVGALAAQGLVPAGGTFADIGSGYGIFLEELKSLDLFGDIVGIEPAPGLAAVCRGKGFRVIEKMVEDVAEGEVRADLATAFEVLEHVFEPVRFLQAAAAVVRPGGILLFTTLTISGFDLQVLWNESKSIYPPHHINLLSVGGIRDLVRRSGLELVEISTPGRLDVDIVSGMAASNRSLPLPRFVESLLASPPSVQEDFQLFLQRSLLSSHIRVLARRPI